MRQQVPAIRFKLDFAVIYKNVQHITYIKISQKNPKTSCLLSNDVNLHV